MKHTLLILFVCLSKLAVAQNWAPVNTSDIYNYQLDTASAISHSLWVDSVGFDGVDSIYYPNRIVKHISNSLALKNQPQFLNKQVTVQANGLFLYQEPSVISYYSQANVSDSYTYDSTNNITATVLSADTAMVLGNLDSIKIIALSSGDTIIASKEHGFVQYPMEYGSGKYYRLVGIEGGRNLGEHVPKFNDFFDYSVGDTFWYYTFSSSWNGYYGADYFEEKKAYVIDTLYRIGDTIFYSFPGVNNYSVKYNLDLPTNDVNGFPNSLRELPNANIANNNYDYHLLWYNAPFPYNYYDNILAMPECDYQPNDPTIYFCSYTPLALAGGFNGKRYNFSYCGNTAMRDTLNYRRYYYANNEMGGSVENNRIFLERIGVTEVTLAGFESFGICRMYAYRLAGDSTITILNQYLNDLIIGIDEPAQANFKLLGNPVSNSINLELETTEVHTLTLYNLNGQQLLQQQTETQTIRMDVAHLPQGVYLLEVRNKQGVTRQRVVKL